MGFTELMACLNRIFYNFGYGSYISFQGDWSGTRVGWFADKYWLGVLEV